MPFQDLARILAVDCRVASNSPLVLGFSGGPDSLALLHALHELDYPVLVAHFDHGLREESMGEARQAEQVAEKYGLPFFTERNDVKAHAQERKLSIEEAARELRYPFLFRVAGERNAQAVAVAHNADDQAETVLMHLLRGAGMAGLRGMSVRSLPNPWSVSIPLVRPLLRVWRSEILEYCEANNLSPVHDPSNQDTTFFRNRLRHELLPQLENLAPGFKDRLINSAELLQADFSLIESFTDAAWQNTLSRRGNDYLAFDRFSFLAEPLALQRALLRRALSELHPNERNLDFDSVGHALEIIRDVKPPKPQDWVAGLFLLCEAKLIWIADWEAELPVSWPQAPEQSVRIEIPAVLELNAGWKLFISEDSQNGWLQKAEQNLDDYQAWIDADAAGEQLVLRAPRPGDRFQPLGMESGSLKLSDFFINEKLPQRARARWPLLCSGDEVIWVPGFRLAHHARITLSTKRALRVVLQQV